jgi:hypothetical protein
VLVLVRLGALVAQDRAPHVRPAPETKQNGDDGSDQMLACPSGKNVVGLV